jgi:hypothetical protein
VIEAGARSIKPFEVAARAFPHVVARRMAVPASLGIVGGENGEGWAND